MTIFTILVAKFIMASTLAFGTVTNGDVDANGQPPAQPVGRKTNPIPAPAPPTTIQSGGVNTSTSKF